MKACSRCLESKTDDKFYQIQKNAKSSLHSKCISCCKIINKERQHLRDKSKKIAYNQAYYAANKEVINKNRRDKESDYAKTYYHTNKAVIREKEKERYHNDTQFRLSKIYRNRLNSYLKGDDKAKTYLAICLDDLKTFIECQFSEGMSWDNRCSVWELDHVIPISKFDLQVAEHKMVCFHWCNLKPIAKTDNKRKSNKLVSGLIQEHHLFCKEYANRHGAPYIDIYEFYNNFLTPTKNTPKGGV